MRKRKADRRTDEEGLRHINFFHAMLLRVFGPADLGSAGPLAGTKYDPAIRRERERRRWEERQARQSGRQPQA